MSDVPSWLTEENVSTATKVVSNPAVQKAAKDPAVQKAARNHISPPSPVSSNQDVEKGNGGGGGGESSEFVVEAETLKAMEKWHLGLRIAYIGSAAFLAAAAALSLQNQGNIGLAFFAFYVFFFSGLLCCFEFALNVSSAFELKS
jgi:hypothetical protein